MDERGFKRGEYGGQRPAYRVSLPAQNARPEQPINNQSQTSASSTIEWKLPLFIFTTLLILLAAGGAYFWQNGKQDAPTKPTSVTAKSIKTYYPALLKSDFQVDKASISKNEDAVIYIARRPDGQTLNVSSQPRPKQDIIDKFNENALVFSEAAESPIGDAQVGNARGYIAGSVVTTDTWVLITGSEKVTVPDIKDFIKNLTTTSLAE